MRQARQTVKKEWSAYMATQMAGCELALAGQGEAAMLRAESAMGELQNLLERREVVGSH